MMDNHDPELHKMTDAFENVTRQLAAANERANTYLAEMVRLQERGGGFDRAREAWKRVHVLAREAEWTILDAYFATGEKEG